MKRLFVIMPFGIKPADKNHNTDEINFDHTYKNLIKPAGEGAGWKVVRIDEIAQSGAITYQYIKEILEADAVLADISLPNGNVYYELGIRQAISTGSTILIALEGSRLPFDIADQRVFFYNETEVDIERAKYLIIEALKSSDESHNPIRSFLETLGVTSNPKNDLAAFEQELQGRIQRAQNRDQLIAVWKWAQNLSPLPPFTLLTLAKQLSQYNEWAVSSNVLRAAVKERPNDFELCRELGWHLSKIGSEYEEEALKCFERALVLNPGDPETYGMMAGLFKRQGKYDKASSYYSKGAEISPNNLYMLVNQAAMKVILYPDNPSEGKALYRKLKEHIEKSIDEGLSEWDEVVLGESCFAIGEFQAAKKHFIAASRIAGSPKSLRSAADQIEVFSKVGFQTQEALALAKWVRELADGLVERIEVKDRPSEIAGVVKPLPVLLHLSDIHFGKRAERDGQMKEMHRFRDGDFSISLSKHITKEFSSQKAHFTHSSEQLYLVISGDLTYRARKEEFELANHCLNEVCEGVGISKERVFIVPGNHDISWNLGKEDLSQRFDNYIAFLNSFYGEDLFRARHPRLKWDLKVGSKRPEPVDLVGFYHYPKSGLTIVGLNSCVYETDQDHYGFIGGRQIRLVEELLDEHSLSVDGSRIAVFHHHLHPFPEWVDSSEEKGVWVDLSTIRDAGIVERQLEKLSFDVVLHGHKHKPQIRETSIRNINTESTDGHKLIVCGAGSVGVNSKELEHNVSNHYQVIEFLRNPRRKGIDFLKVEWRVLEVSPEAEWTTPGSWVITG